VCAHLDDILLSWTFVPPGKVGKSLEAFESTRWRGPTHLGVYDSKVVEHLPNDMEVVEVLFLQR
jgi:hypothetical protein